MFCLNAKVIINKGKEICDRNRPKGDWKCLQRPHDAVRTGWRITNDGDGFAERIDCKRTDGNPLLGKLILHFGGT